MAMFPHTSLEVWGEGGREKGEEGEVDVDGFLHCTFLSLELLGGVDRGERDRGARERRGLKKKKRGKEEKMDLSRHVVLSKDFVRVCRGWSTIHAAHKHHALAMEAKTRPNCIATLHADGQDSSPSIVLHCSLVAVQVC